MICVTLENPGENLEIKGIASDPDEKNTYSVRRYNDLPSIINTVVNGICDSKLTLQIISKCVLLKALNFPLL